MPFNIFAISSASHLLDEAKAPQSGVNTPILLVIASQPRCGSHMLGQMLFTDGRFGCPLEYFHSRHWNEWCIRTSHANPSVELTDERVLQEICKWRTSEFGIAGIKTHWPQFERKLETNLKRSLINAKFIYLRRRDVIAQAVSYEIAHQSGAWVAEAEEKREPVFQRDAVDLRVRTIVEQRKKWSDFFRTHNPERLDLWYEAIVSAPVDAFQAIERFAGLKPKYGGCAAPPFPTRKQETSRNRLWKAMYLFGEQQRDRNSRSVLSPA